MEIIFLYVTASNKDEARRIGTELVNLKLAACVNIIDGMESVYRWEGKIEQGREAILIVKTVRGAVEKAAEKIKALHSYSCPCILTIPIESGNPGYVKWLFDNVEA